MLSPQSLNITIQAQLVPEAYRITRRKIKSRLHVALPEAKSSHLAEAIAFALGFKSNAALLASGIPEHIAIASFDPILFCERLQQLQHPSSNSFMVGSEADTAPVHLLELVRASALIGRSSLRDHQTQIYEQIRFNSISREAARVTAEALGLGIPSVPNFPLSSNRDGSEGADYSSCLPGWGRMVSNDRKGFLNPLFGESAWRFERELPVSGGRKKVYTDAVLALVHDRGEWRATQTSDVEHQAAVRGWKYTLLDGWFGDAKPMLLRRATSHSRVLELWNNSFVRWVCENEHRLKSFSNKDAWHLAVEDVIECPHFPLDITGFDDLIERYLSEVPYPTLNFPDHGQIESLNVLISRWNQERA